MTLKDVIAVLTATKNGKVEKMEIDTASDKDGRPTTKWDCLQGYTTWDGYTVEDVLKLAAWTALENGCTVSIEWLQANAN